MNSLDFPGDRDGRVPVRLLVFIAVATTCVWAYLRLFEEPGKPVPDSLPYRNTQPGIAYLGDEACAKCHAEIAESFRRHPMGRSMTTPEKVLPESTGKVAEFQDLAYWIERRDGKIFHQESKTMQDTGPAETTEHEIRYVIGSGTRGYAFLVEHDNKLFQSPISWYTQEKTWDLAPSYRRHNRHFDREITGECLFCHTNRVEMTEDKPIKFHGLSIGCERCHGPGALHARNPEVVDGVDLTIVNPAKLKPVALRENVCEQCHFLGFRRSEDYVGSSFDYRPGLSLEKFVTIVPERSNLTFQLQPDGHVEQMRMSRCYEGSKKSLGCTSCHDPHTLPEPTERVAYYQKRCLDCHADRGCSMATDTRLKKSPADDCISCHMPKLPMGNIAHTAATNHSVPRVP